MQNGLPFDMRLTCYNADTLAAIEEVQEMKRNPHKHKGFHNITDLFEELESDE